MNKGWRGATAILSAAVLLMGAAPFAAAADNASDPGLRRVLVLQGIDPWLPAAVKQDQAMREVLSRAPGTPIEIVTEHIDSHRFRGADLETPTLALLSEKYRDVHVDIIVAVGKAGLDFAARHRSRLWGGAPIVFLSVAPEQVRNRPLPPDTTGVLAALDAGPTLALARRLQPEARRLVIVGGVAPTDQLRVQRVVDAALGQGLEVVRLDDQSLSQTLKSLMAVSRDSIVFFASMLRDAAGNAHVPTQLVAQISAASAAPVYANASSYLGEGVVGGVFNDFAADGQRAGTMVVEILQGSLRPDAPLVEPRVAACSVDARQLQRWGLPQSLLPGECTLAFEGHGLWAQHRIEVVVLGLLIALQALLIALLLRQRRRTLAAAMEAQQARSELAHAARRAMVGELTAAISHEINQPLGAVQSNADAAEMILESADPELERVREILGEIRAANLRASEVVQRLRRLLLKQPARFEEVDLAEVVDTVMRLLGYEMQRRRVAVAVTIAERPLPVTGDAIQLQQVLLNLLMNAMDAVAENPAERRRIHVRLMRRTERCAVLEVTDTGLGISLLALPRLFDSFQSTKKQGMGMGLSITRTIIQAHGGHIEAANCDFGGARFTVTLPALPMRDLPAAAPVPAALATMEKA